MKGNSSLQIGAVAKKTDLSVFSSSERKFFDWKKSFRTILYERLRKLLYAHQGSRIFFPGFMRTVAILCAALQPKGPIIVNLDSFYICLNGQDTVMTPEILTWRTHEPEETKLITQYVKSGMTFLDLGANIGYFTVMASQLVGRSGKIYAFEPDSTNLEYLNKNIILNQLQNVKVFPKVVSNISGKTYLYLDKGNLGGHTCAKENIQTDCKERFEVDSLTLDGFVKEENISRIDFIKMDVQGAEGLVLGKAIETIQRFPVKILMEFWPKGLRSLGTDPYELLKFLGKFFEIKVIGGGKEDNSKILKMAEANSYLNLFLEKIIS